jgi:hypothetical protein
MLYEQLSTVKQHNVAARKLPKMDYEQITEILNNKASSDELSLTKEIYQPPQLNVLNIKQTAGGQGVFESSGGPIS